jgi:hypothetical protein
MFGDHSHEPVPIAIAHVSDVVAADAAESWRRTPLEPLPVLHQHMDVDEAELVQQAQASADRLGRETDGEEDDGPVASFGDAVRRYDEVSAAAGCLGRFPSSELMPLLLSVIKVLR